MRLIVTILLFLLLMWNIASAQTDAVKAQLDHEDRIIKAVILGVPVVLGLILVLARLFKTPRGYQPIDTLDTRNPPKQEY